MKNSPSNENISTKKKIIQFGLQTITPNFIKNIFLMAKYRCLIDLGANIYFVNNIKIGKGTVIKKCTIISQNKITIGQNCIIENQVEINSKTDEIIIGDNTSINTQCIIHGNGGVIIGNNVAIAPGVKILKSHLIPPTTLEGKFTYLDAKPTVIKDNCWICANSLIIDGVTIGSCTIIGANSFVNISIPDCVLAVGTPIQIIKNRK